MGMGAGIAIVGDARQTMLSSCCAGGEDTDHGENSLLLTLRLL